MITTQRHQLRPLAQPRHRTMSPQLLQRLRHLLARNTVVHGRDGDVAAVDDLGPALIRIDARSRVEAAEGSLA